MWPEPEAGGSDVDTPLPPTLTLKVGPVGVGGWGGVKSLQLGAHPPGFKPCSTAPWSCARHVPSL